MSVTSLNGIQNAVTAVSLNSGISITTAGQELNFNALSGGVTSIIADGQSTAGDITLVGAGSTTITNDGNNTITITSSGSSSGSSIANGGTTLSVSAGGNLATSMTDTATNTNNIVLATVLPTGATPTTNGYIALQANGASSSSLTIDCAGNLYTGSAYNSTDGLSGALKIWGGANSDIQFGQQPGGTNMDIAPDGDLVFNATGSSAGNTNLINFTTTVPSGDTTNTSGVITFNSGNSIKPGIITVGGAGTSTGLWVGDTLTFDGAPIGGGGGGSSITAGGSTLALDATGSLSLITPDTASNVNQISLVTTVPNTTPGANAGDISINSGSTMELQSEGDMLVRAGPFGRTGFQLSAIPSEMAIVLNGQTAGTSTNRFSLTATAIPSQPAGDTSSSISFTSENATHPGKLTVGGTPQTTGLYVSNSELLFNNAPVGGSGGSSITAGGSTLALDATGSLNLTTTDVPSNVNQINLTTTVPTTTPGGNAGDITINSGSTLELQSEGDMTVGSVGALQLVSSSDTRLLSTNTTPAGPFTFGLHLTPAGNITTQSSNVDGGSGGGITLLGGAGQLVELGQGGGGILRIDATGDVIAETTTGTSGVITLQSGNSSDPGLLTVGGADPGTGLYVSNGTLSYNGAPVIGTATSSIQNTGGSVSATCQATNFNVVAPGYASFLTNNVKLISVNQIANDLEWTDNPVLGNSASIGWNGSKTEPQLDLVVGNPAASPTATKTDPHPLSCYAGEWAPNAFYGTGTIALSGGLMYVRLSYGTGTSAPASDTANWAPLGGGGAGVPNPMSNPNGGQDQNQWVSGQAYIIGSVVYSPTAPYNWFLCYVPVPTGTTTDPQADVDAGSSFGQGTYWQLLSSPSEVGGGTGVNKGGMSVDYVSGNTTINTTGTATLAISSTDTLTVNSLNGTTIQDGASTSLTGYSKISVENGNITIGTEGANLTDRLVLRVATATGGVTYTQLTLSPGAVGGAGSGWTLTPTGLYLNGVQKV